MKLVGGLTSSELSDLVDQAVDSARIDLWMVKPWTFRRHQHTLVISSEEDRYELPNNFAAIATARENESLYGMGLVFVGKDEFDRRVPRPGGYTGGNPRLYTVYAETDNKKKYIQFFPRPTVTPIHLNILITAPSNVSEFPDSARAALIAVAQKYLFLPGTLPFDSAYGLAEREIQKMEVEDSLYVEDEWKFFDDTDERSDVRDRNNYRWYYL